MINIVMLGVGAAALKHSEAVLHDSSIYFLSCFVSDTFKAIAEDIYDPKTASFHRSSIRSSPWFCTTVTCFLNSQMTSPFTSSIE